MAVGAVPQVEWVAKTADGAVLVVPEQTTVAFKANLVDELGLPLAGSNVTALTLTIYAKETGEPIINNVDHVDILNVGRGSLDENGVLIITLEPSDTTLTDQAHRYEYHRALIEGQWAGGMKQFRIAIDYTVKNLAKV